LRRTTEMAKARKAAKKARDLSGDLRQAIADSGRTHYAIGKAAGVAPEVIDRFVSGERDIRLATASKLASALRLKLKSESPESGEEG